MIDEDAQVREEDREAPLSPELNLFDLMRKRAYRYRCLSIALRSSIRYRIGAALVQSATRRREAFRLPGRLWHLFQEARQENVSDDQVGRARRAEQAGAALLADETEPDGLLAALDRLLADAAQEQALRLRPTRKPSPQPGIAGERPTPRFLSAGEATRFRAAKAHEGR